MSALASSGQASPADLRNDLDPAAVDTLADQLHVLSCVPLAGRSPSWPEHHRDFDRSRARFILIGLRETGWRLQAEE